MSDYTSYGLSDVFWGRNFPTIRLYDSSSTMTHERTLSNADGFKMNFRFEEVLDGRRELEDGTIRKRVRGYRMFADFSVYNIKNRELLIFLSEMWTAQRIMFTPHSDAMRNPRTLGYDFEVFVDSNFTPEYFDGRWIGHTISFTLTGMYLLSRLPEDHSMIKLIEATTTRSAGVTSADPQTSTTYFGEKLWYGGWELTDDDYKLVAFFEQPEDSDELIDYGKLW